MKKPMSFGSLFVVFAVGAQLLLFSCTPLSSDTEFTPLGTVIVAGASRLSGVAPLYVYFNATIKPGSAEFRTLDYSWDFDDSHSPEWGTTGLPSNRAKGAVAAHVFDRPGTYSVSLTVRNGTRLVEQKHFLVTVDDPDIIYAGDKTICISDASSNDFTGAPDGALCIATDDLSTITAYAQPGRRLLFRRGSNWTTGPLDWPSGPGPVTIGAYGAGIDADVSGRFSNNPAITCTGGAFLVLDHKQDWRVMDLAILGPDFVHGSCTGSMEIRQFLFYRLHVQGFANTLGWSHWNTSSLMPLDQMAIVSCLIEGADSIVVYIGSERLALMGNIVRNARDSHVVRIWQAYLGVISNNIISGASLDATSDGRHALKLHGPGYSTLHGVNEFGTPRPETALLGKRTEYVILADNIFGSSGPWPVTIGPQDGLTDALLTNIVFERNRVHSDFGSSSGVQVSTGLHLWSRDSVVRNNVFDGTGSGADYTAVVIERRGREPLPRSIEVYHNTIFRADNESGNIRAGVQVNKGASKITVRNNFIAFPSSLVPVFALRDFSGFTSASNNIISADPRFIDPFNPEPLLRDFHLGSGSTAVDSGVHVPVYEDFDGRPRTTGIPDPGAFEY